MAVDGVDGGQHAERRKRDAAVVLDVHEAVVLGREDGRERMRGRDETELCVFGNLAVDHRDVFVRSRRLIETRVEVLEQPARDRAELVEFVDRAQQKRLVQHRRHEGVGDLVARHVDHGHSRHALTAPEVGLDLGPALIVRGADARLEVESLLEVDVDQVISADKAIERQRAAEDVDAAKARRLAGLGHQVARDVFEIRELAPELLHEIGAARGRLVVRANRHLPIFADRAA